MHRTQTMQALKEITGRLKGLFALFQSAKGGNLDPQAALKRLECYENMVNVTHYITGILMLVIVGSLFFQWHDVYHLNRWVWATLLISLIISLSLKRRYEWAKVAWADEFTALYYKFNAGLFLKGTWGPEILGDEKSLKAAIQQTLLELAWEAHFALDADSNQKASEKFMRAHQAALGLGVAENAKTYFDKAAGKPEFAGHPVVMAEDQVLEDQVLGDDAGGTPNSLLAA